MGHVATPCYQFLVLLLFFNFVHVKLGYFKNAICLSQFGLLLQNITVFYTLLDGLNNIFISYSFGRWKVQDLGVSTVRF